MGIEERPAGARDAGGASGDAAAVPDGDRADGADECPAEPFSSCDACGGALCGEARSACAGDLTCSDVTACREACGPDFTCHLRCGPLGDGGNSAVTRADDLAECLRLQCPEVCARGRDWSCLGSVAPTRLVDSSLHVALRVRDVITGAAPAPPVTVTGVLRARRVRDGVVVTERRYVTKPDAVTVMIVGPSR